MVVQQTRIVVSGPHNEPSTPRYGMRIVKNVNIIIDNEYQKIPTSFIKFRAPRNMI